VILPLNLPRTWRTFDSARDTDVESLDGGIRKQKQIPFGNDNQKSKSKGNSVAERAGTKAGAWPKEQEQRQGRGWINVAASI
jgi:hypothetical protein